MRKSILLFALLAIVGFTACNDKLICPAYQSYYIFDEKKRDDMFAMFGEDSLPKMGGDVAKNKYGLVAQAKLLPYQRKKQELNTVHMETVMPTLLSETTSDSVGTDSNFLSEEVFGGDEDAWKRLAPREISFEKRETGINVDQKNYALLLGDYLLAQQEADAAAEAAANGEDPFGEPGFGEFEEPEEKKGFFGFFKNLFKKKDKGGDALDDGEEGFGDDGSEDIDLEAPEDTGDEFFDEEPRRKKKKKDKAPKQKKEKKPKEKKEKKPKVKKEKKEKAPKEEKPPKEKKKKKKDDDSDDF